LLSRGKKTARLGPRQWHIQLHGFDTLLMPFQVQPQALIKPQQLLDQAIALLVPPVLVHHPEQATQGQQQPDKDECSAQPQAARAWVRCVVSKDHGIQSRLAAGRQSAAGCQWSILGKSLMLNSPMAKVVL